jgi:hypothetical protein
MIGQRKPRTKIGKALAFLLSINVKRGDIAKAARLFKVNRKTLTDDWSKLLRIKEVYPLESNDRAILRALHLKEARGASSNRLLTDQQEELVVRKLRTEYPQGFTDHDIVQVCRSLFRESRSHPREYSYHFVQRFKVRCNIRSSKIRVYQRVKEEKVGNFDKDLNRALRYIDEVEQLGNQYPASRFINVDECPSYVRNLPTKALHFTDRPAPWIVVHAKARDCVTVLGAVAGTGNVIGTAVVAKGSTKRCEEKFRAKLPSAFVQHTKSGLTTTESFIEYLEHVILPYTKDQPAVLIADAYPAHTTKEVKNFCKAHQLEYVIVPDRATATLQPLDVAVFGSAKFKIHQDVKHTMFQSNTKEANRWQATANCVKAINGIGRNNGKRAWIETFPFWPNVLGRLRSR